MNPIIVSILFITIVQLYSYGFGILIILCIIGRGCYLARTFGRNIETHICRRFEYASIIWFLFKFIAVKGSHFDTKGFVLNIIASIIVMIIEYYDSENFSYYIDEVEVEESDNDEINFKNK